MVACDSTGYESGHVSPYYSRRCGRKQHDFPKLNAAIDIASHLTLAAIAQRGPAPDDPAFHDLIDQAATRASFKLCLADAGYDGEAHHQFLHARGVFGVIPPTRGRPRQDGAPPGGMTRSLLHQRWEQLLPRYGHRWQIETRFSMDKRKFGSALRSRSPAAQQREGLLRQITLNLMLEPKPATDE